MASTNRKINITLSDRQIVTVLAALARYNRSLVAQIDVCKGTPLADLHRAIVRQVSEVQVAIGYQLDQVNDGTEHVEEQ